MAPATRRPSDGTVIPSLIRPRRRGSGGNTGRPESAEQAFSRLEADNATLRAETATLTTEREILRKAKYFAGETSW